MHRRLTPVIAALVLVLGGTAATATSQTTPDAAGSAEQAAARHREPPRIVPTPATVATLGGSPFSITPQTQIAVPDDVPDVAAVADYLADLLRRST